MCAENEFLFWNENVSPGVLALHRDKSVTLICLGCCFLLFHLFPGCLLARSMKTLVFVAAQASRGPFVPRIRRNRGCGIAIYWRAPSQVTA